MKRENLVFLVYSPNTCYTQLLEEEPKGCLVDLEKGVWTFEGNKVFKIGTEMRYCEWGCRWGLIGVYDRSNLGHLKNLLHDAREAVRGPSCMSDD